MTEKNKHIPWNRGLTKYSDNRIMKVSIEMSGKIRSKEHSLNISLSKIGVKNIKKSIQMKDNSSGSKNLFYGHHHTQETKNKISIANKGRRYPGRKLPSLMGNNNPSKRPEVRLLISKRVSETHWNTSLEKNPNWRGGISFLPYKPYRHLKNQIIHRDKSDRCLLCGEDTKVRVIHHIDYIKVNNNLNNLCILCNSCNSKVNKNRSYWENYFVGRIKDGV